MYISLCMRIQLPRALLYQQYPWTIYSSVVFLKVGRYLQTQSARESSQRDPSLWNPYQGPTMGRSSSHLINNPPTMSRPPVTLSLINEQTGYIYTSTMQRSLRVSMRHSVGDRSYLLAIDILSLLHIDLNSCRTHLLLVFLQLVHSINFFVDFFCDCHLKKKNIRCLS